MRGWRESEITPEDFMTVLTSAEGNKYRFSLALVSRSSDVIRDEVFTSDKFCFYIMNHTGGKEDNAAKTGQVINKENFHGDRCPLSF